MRDEIDTYISRCLKNWTARNRLPEDGRARLLKTAARLADASEQTLPAGIETHPVIHRPYDGPPHIFFEPITQSRFWSFHIATSMRLAT